MEIAKKQKNIFLGQSLVMVLMLFFILLPQIVDAEEISSFEQSIVMEKNSVILVEEIIAYDFGEAKRHGIFRDISYKYKARGGNYKLRLDVLSVVDGQNNKLPFILENKKTIKRIKIGDPKMLLSGKHIYKIKYSLGRTINFFSAYDELYWNVTGHEWQYPIKQSKLTIKFPEPISEEKIQAKCFSGVFGSQDECVSKRFDYNDSGLVVAAVFIDDLLFPRRGLSIALTLPKNIILPPSTMLKIWEIVRDNWIVALPVVVFLIFFFWWKKYGQDPIGRGTIVAQFTPPEGFDPLALGILVDEVASNKDFSAQILSLAVKGQLKIIKIKADSFFKKDDYALLKTVAKKELSFGEALLQVALFKDKYLLRGEEKSHLIKSSGLIEDVDKVILISGLKNSFYKDLREIKKQAYDDLCKKGYFRDNPAKVRAKYLFSVLFLGIVALVLLGNFLGMIAILSVIISIVVALIFSFFMPQKTNLGVVAKEHILGLKRYLSVAERDRIDFHNAPEKNPTTFEKLLPYAMVLGLEKKWAKQFENIYDNQNPSWYQSLDGGMFSALSLTNNLNSFAKAAKTAVISTPSSASSGGSGFSGGGVGGGFGGGGGGSW